MSKTVDGELHTYYYAGGRLLRETYGNNVLDFTYDAGGNPFSLTYNGTKYYYVTNLQGDVYYLVDTNGNIAASYTYDPFGKVLTATGDIAEINPLRYRGYYYDTGSGFYYLQSRYYDPNTCRFINADIQTDSAAEFKGYNLFTYCANNPVIYKDLNGNSIILCIIIGAIVGTVIGAGVGACIASNVYGLTPEDGWDYWKIVVFGGVCGGALGGLAGWAFAGHAATATITWAEYKAAHIASSTYAIGRMFEEWFYDAYNVVSQQIRYAGYRFDAIFQNCIVELKNYNWDCYSSYSGIIHRFVAQAQNYMQFIGETIEGQLIEGVTFLF